ASKVTVPVTGLQQTPACLPMSVTDASFEQSCGHIGTTAKEQWMQLPSALRRDLGSEFCLPDPEFLYNVCLDDLDRHSLVSHYASDAAELEFFTSILKTLQVQSSAAASLCRKRRAAAHPSLQWLAVCKQPRMVETVVPPVDSLEWLCHHSGAHKRARIRVPKNCPNSRADAELSSQLRWQRKLATILIDSCAPALSGATGQTGELRALRLAGNTRSSTLKKHIQMWHRYSKWLHAAYQLQWLTTCDMVLDFLEELAAQPCGKTVPEAFCATLQFMERVAGIALEFRLGKQTAVLRTVEQLSAQLETGAPPSRKARPQPLILILALELWVMNISAARYTRAFAWAKLVKFWSSSRSDDLLGLVPQLTVLIVLTASSMMQLANIAGPVDRSQAASPDLKYHLSEVKVPVEVQAALFHKGFVDLQLFAGLDESRLEVRNALAVEIGLKHDECTDARQNVARLLSAWESSRAQLVAEDKMKAESKLGQTPRIVQCSEMAALRKAVEADLGKLQDDEVPAKSLIATKLEQIESGDLRAEDLREVLCVEDTDVDLFSGIIEHGTGNLKIKPGKASIAMPSTPEELRLRHRRIGIAWLMVGSKHKNQSWITPALLEAFRRFSDHIVGRHIAGFPIMAQGVTRHPAWNLVLSYELEVRKRAYKQLRDGKHSSLQEALEDAWNSAELINKHFLVPLTASADFFSTASHGEVFTAHGKGAQCFAGLQTVLDKHTDGRRLLFELACKKHVDQPFPAALVKEAREAVKGILRKHGAQLDLDAIPERQPFHLALLEEFLRLCNDPDASAYFSGKDSFAAGVSLGVNQKMPRTPAVFEKKCKWRAYDGETTAADVFRNNYPGAAENAKAIEAQFVEEAKLGDLRQVLQVLEKPTFVLTADIKRAHRLVKIKPEDWGLQACRTDESSSFVWLNTVGTFGVASAAVHWSHLFSGIQRAVYYLTGTLKLFLLTYVDDLLFITQGKAATDAIVVALLFMVVLGVPLSWHKCKGGTQVEWVGYYVDLEQKSVGISEKRADWICNWVETTVAAGVVKLHDFSAVLGRLSFAMAAIEHLRPFLGPLYAWSAALENVVHARLPKAVIYILRFIEHMLKHGWRTRPVGPLQEARRELFRADAKAEGEVICIGGWAIEDGPDTKSCRWFSERLTRSNAPWAFLAGESFRAIASLELFATLVSLVLFKPACYKGSMKISAGTDNLGNTHLIARLMSTKFPLCAILMEVAAVLMDGNHDLQLEWLPRLQNQEADNLTNEIFHGFSEDRRLRFRMEEYEGLVLQAMLNLCMELYEDVRKARDRKVSQTKRVKTG
ncbi:unnamed protein product, partial [Cladocopium goreaui]